MNRQFSIVSIDILPILPTRGIRLGQVDDARLHLNCLGQHLDPSELQKLQLIEKHLKSCAEARKIRDWKTAMKEADAALAAGADSSPQVKRTPRALWFHPVVSR